jgi:hypothetical protein
MWQAQFNPAGFLIRNIIYPRPIPKTILALLSTYLVDPRLLTSPSPWKLYADYCTVSRGITTDSKEAKPLRRSVRDDEHTVPVIKGATVQCFKHTTREHAVWWMPSAQARTCPSRVRLASKEVMSFTSTRRLHTALLSDTYDAEHVWGNQTVVIHEFSKASVDMAPFTTEQRARIFCCFLNSDLLEMLFRSFEYTNHITAGKLKKLPVPDMCQAIIPTTWTPDWDILQALDPNFSVNLLLDSLDSPSGTSDEEKMGCVLLCLETIGRKMHQLTRTKKNGVVEFPDKAKRVLAIMNRFVNNIYNLSIADEDYIKAFYRDFLHVNRYFWSG